MTHNVAVYGASGHTGGFVASELERRGVAVRRISRRAAAEPTRRAPWAASACVSCDEPDALDGALEGADAVINCAGPFLDTAPAIVEGALRAEAHYLDLAAEQRSVRQTLATYEADAADKGVVVLPAMAFYGGLADLLAAQLCQGWRTIDAILIGVALDSWHPTAGTRRTGERNTARRLFVSGGRLTPLPSAAAGERWHFPLPFGDLPVARVPLSEIVTISKHITADRIESFMNEAPLQDLSRADTPPPIASDAHGRSSQAFAMDVYATGDGQARRIAAFGRDIYAVSGPLVVEACMRVLSKPPHRGGAYAPAELFDPQQFLAALSSDLRVVNGSQSSPLGMAQTHQ